MSKLIKSLITASVATIGGSAALAVSPVETLLGKLNPSQIGKFNSYCSQKGVGSDNVAGKQQCLIDLIGKGPGINLSSQTSYVTLSQRLNNLSPEDIANAAKVSEFSLSGSGVKVANLNDIGDLAISGVVDRKLISEKAKLAAKNYPETVNAAPVVAVEESTKKPLTTRQGSTTTATKVEDKEPVAEDQTKKLLATRQGTAKSVVTATQQAVATEDNATPATKKSLPGIRRPTSNSNSDVVVNKVATVDDLLNNKATPVVTETTPVTNKSFTGIRRPTSNSNTAVVNKVTSLDDLLNSKTTTAVAVATVTKVASQEAAEATAPANPNDVFKKSPGRGIAASTLVQSQAVAPTAVATVTKETTPEPAAPANPHDVFKKSPGRGIAASTLIQNQAAALTSEENVDATGVVPHVVEETNRGVAFVKNKEDEQKVSDQLSKSFKRTILNREAKPKDLDQEVGLVNADGTVTKNSKASNPFTRVLDSELNKVAQESKEEVTDLSNVISKDLKGTENGQKVLKALEYAHSLEAQARKNADDYIKKVKSLTNNNKLDNVLTSNKINSFINLGKADDQFASTNIKQILGLLNKDIDFLSQDITKRNSEILIKLRDSAEMNSNAQRDVKEILGLEINQLKNYQAAQETSVKLLDAVREETIALNDKFIAERRALSAKLVDDVLKAEQKAEKTGNYQSEDLLLADLNLEYGLGDLLFTQSQQQAQQEVKVKEVSLQVKYLLNSAENSILTRSQLAVQRNIAKQTLVVEQAILKAQQAILNAETVRALAIKSLARPPVDFSNLNAQEFKKFIEICKDQGSISGADSHKCVTRLTQAASVYNSSPSSNKFTLRALDAKQSSSVLNKQILNSNLKSKELAKQEIIGAEIAAQKSVKSRVVRADQEAQDAYKVEAKETAERIKLRDASRNALLQKSDVASRSVARNEIRRKKELAQATFNSYSKSPEAALKQDTFINTDFGTGQVDFKIYFDTLFKSAGLIKSKEFGLDAARTNVKLAENYYIPKLTASVVYKYNPNIEGNLNSRTDKQINLAATLFNDQVSNNKADARAKLELAEIEIVKEKERIAVTVVNNLISIHEYNKLITIAESILGQTQKLYTDLLTSYNNGVARESDLQNAELLYQRINTEIASINREIINLKDNIQASSGLSYPVNGVKLPDNLINEISHLPSISDTELLSHNIEIRQAQLNADIAKYQADNQINRYNVQAIGQQKFAGDKLSDSDTYIGIQANVNIFDYNANMKNKAGESNYLASLASRDFKVREVKQSLLGLYNNDKNNVEELKALQIQEHSTKNLIESQTREYQVNNSTLYQMLNTKFDLFTTQRSLTEKKILSLINKVTIHQTFGKLLDLINVE